MKKKTCGSATVLVLLFVCGCASMRFYPEQGQLAQQAPLPVLKGTMGGAFYSGSIKVKMPDGEVCRGHWTSVPKNAPMPTNPADAQLEGEMVRLWDEMYGHQFYESQVRGSKMHMRGVLKGTNGTTINVELYKPPVDVREKLQTQVESIVGIAKDNKGNVYKITFS